MSLFNSLLLVIAGATQRQLAAAGPLPEGRKSNPAKQAADADYDHAQRAATAGKVRGQTGERDSAVGDDRYTGNFPPLDSRRKPRRSKRHATGKARPPHTAEDVRQLVIKLAKENTWGYARIVGELKKLGIRSIKKSTVRNILKAEGLDPCPQRAGATWDEFISRHADSLWQCDFVLRKVLTVGGWREAFLLVFLNVQTRRVVCSLPPRSIAANDENT